MQYIQKNSKGSLGKESEKEKDKMAEGWYVLWVNLNKESSLILLTSKYISRNNNLFCLCLVHYVVFMQRPSY